MTALNFSLHCWAAWAPGLADAPAWRRWARGELQPDAAASGPDVQFVPALQRRRLNALSRMMFAVTHAVLGATTGVPIILHSRHGDLQRTRELLTAIAAREPCSPNDFSLSVHNAVLGQWSIFRGDQARTEAIAATAAGLEHSLLLAGGLLAEGADRVLVVVCETPGPEPYAPWTRDVAFPHALALQVGPGDDLSLEIAEPAAAGAGTLTSALVFLRHYLGGEPSWECPDELRAWHWRARAFREPVAVGAPAPA